MADKAVVMSAFTDNFNRARLLAASASHSGDWLHALPMSTYGLRLDNEAVRVAVDLRLGTSLCEPHQCPVANRLTQEVLTASRASGAPADPYDNMNSTTLYTER